MLLPKTDILDGILFTLDIQEQKERPTVMLNIELMKRKILWLESINSSPKNSSSYWEIQDINSSKVNKPSLELILEEDHSEMELISLIQMMLLELEKQTNWHPQFQK